MKTIIVRSIIVLSFFLALENAFAETFLCIGEKGSGFRYDAIRKEWITASFAVDTERYIVRKPAGKEIELHKNSIFIVQKIGENLVHGVCKQQDQYGRVWCDTIGGYFRLNLELGRYISSYEVGYIDENIDSAFGLPRQEGGNTPSLVIGKCSKIQ